MLKRKLTITLAVLTSAGFGIVPSIASARHGRHGRSATQGHNRRGHAQDITGTVASFDATSGLLKITRADGTTASAAVTSSTEIECEATTAAAHVSSHGGSSGSGDNGSGSNAGRGDNAAGDDNPQVGEDNAQADDDNAAATTPATAPAQDEQGVENEGQEPAGEDASEVGGNPAGAPIGSPDDSTSPAGGAQQACDASALKAGTKVRRARLRTSAGGATAAFKQIKLEI